MGLTPKQKRIVNVAWKQVEDFIKDWQDSPFEWNTERDIQAEVATRIKSALKKCDIDTYEADYIYKTLIYDTYLFGWATANDDETFTYKTKAFSLPRQVLFHKRIYIEAEGDFVVQFLGDDNIVSSMTVSLAEKTQLYLNIRPYRYQNFSFKFIGQQNCKIYDYGVDE